MFNLIISFDCCVLSKTFPSCIWLGEWDATRTSPCYVLQAWGHKCREWWPTRWEESSRDKQQGAQYKTRWYTRHRRQSVSQSTDHQGMYVIDKIIPGENQYNPIKSIQNSFEIVVNTLL